MEANPGNVILQFMQTCEQTPGNSDSFVMIEPTETSGTKRYVVSGNAMLPLYRHGDHLIVSMQAAPRVGDRVVVQTKAGSLLGGTLIAYTAQKLHLARGGNLRRDIVLSLEEIHFVGRVNWASQ